MATCLSTIKRSLRMLGVLAAGREPTANDAATAQEVLTGLYVELITNGSLGQLNPVLVRGNYTARENDRIVNDGTAAVAITLPATITPVSTGPDTWCTPAVDETRPPKDRAVVVIAGNPTAAYLYEANVGAWVYVNVLAQTDQAPLSVNMPEGLAARLAISLAAEFGADVPKPVALAASAWMSSLTGRYGEPREATPAEYF
jgi:hypothetical protein